MSKRLENITKKREWRSESSRMGVNYLPNPYSLHGYSRQPTHRIGGK